MVLNSYIIYKERQELEEPISIYLFCVSIIESNTDEWPSLRNEDTGGADDNRESDKRMFGLEKLEGKKEKLCFVCTKRCHYLKER